MRIVSSFALPLLALTLLVAVSRPATAQDTIDQGLHPPGSAGDLVNDRGVPQAGEAPIPYVIVTSRALRPAFLELGREHIRGGIRSGVRSLESLLSAYPNAIDDPDRIRQFLRDAHAVWGTQYVLLGGDSDVLPPRYVTTPSVLGERHFVSDWYFACLDGTWDADHDGRYGEAPDFGTGDPGDQPDLEPELFVGRAPVSTLEEARRFVNKTIAYGQRGGDAFENTTLMFANELAPFLDFADFAEQLLPLMVDDPAQQVTRLYQSFDNPAWVPGALPENPAAVADALDRGANVTFGFGAGSTDLLEAGDRFGPDPYLTVSQVLGLTNGDRAGHVWLLTSFVGAFDTPTSLAEAFLRAPAGGAVTVISPSDLTLALMSSELTREFAKVVFDEGAASIGEALVRARVPLLPYYASTTLVLSYQLLGDPLLRVFSSSPVASATGGGAHGRTGISAAAAGRDDGMGVGRIAELTTAIRASETPTRGVLGGDASARATRFALAPPAPSPATSRARISCTVPAELAGTPIRGTVLDLAGRAVRGLSDPLALAGVVTFEWDLRDDQGARVPAGVYFVRVTAGARSETRRLLVAGTQ